MLQSEALEILKTGANVFLTGEPGSGKTHTINEYVKYLRSHGVEPAVTASTGIAATHISGMTIYSWSGIGIREKLQARDFSEILKNRSAVDRIREAKILIIDEVSMLSANVLNMVDAVCRRFRMSEQSFGGLQVVVVGDFFQLPPVVKRKPLENKQLSISKSDSEALFAFDASAWSRAEFKVCYLTEQHRQSDQDFLGLLSAIRRNNFSEKFFSLLENRCFDKEKTPTWATKLFSHNIDVDNLNNQMLGKLFGVNHKFVMSGLGNKRLVEILKKNCLSPENLYLKTGAVVMFTKNNPHLGFANGTLGKVVGFDKDNGCPLVKIKTGEIIKAEPMDWLVEDAGEPLAKITQIPLRLAWAITVHKSQGMSLDVAVMDLGGVFEYGQGYVALSRVRSLSGLYLLGWNEKTFQIHPEVLARDGEFRAASGNLVIDFFKISLSKIQEKQKEFLRNSGGQETLVEKIFKSRRLKKIRKEVKIDTRMASYNLFKSGKTISEIAKDRGFVESTIENHLAFFVENGQLKINELVLKKKVLAITKVAQKVGLEKLSPLKEILGEEYSYGEIRFVVNHLKYLDKK